MYEVMVRLTLPTETSRAGKKMKEERGEKLAEKEARQRVRMI
jgi:hypothetical protein